MVSSIYFHMDTKKYSLRGTQLLKRLIETSTVSYWYNWIWLLHILSMLLLFGILKVYQKL